MKVTAWEVTCGAEIQCRTSGWSHSHPPHCCPHRAQDHLSSFRSSGGRLGWGQALTGVLWGAAGVGSGPHCSPLGVSGVGSGPHCSPLGEVTGVGSGPHCSPLGVSGVGSSLHDVMRSCMCRMDCCLMSDPCLRTSRTLVPVGQSNPLGLLHWAGTWS